MTAQELFGEVNRDTRGQAKTINFAILYGISRWGLAGRLGVTADEAQAMIDRYFERFPGIRDYIAETLTSARARTASPTTLFGRKTHFPRIKSQRPARAPGRRTRRDQRADPGHQRRHHQARDGADGRRRWPTAGLGGVRMLLQVHDELVFEVPEGDVEAAERGDPRRSWPARPSRR